MQPAPSLNGASGDRIRRKKEGLVQRNMGRVFYVAIMLVPVFLCMAAYSEFGLFVSGTRPRLSGTITQVMRDQGKHHITLASIDFPDRDGSQAICHVDTWFRGTDEGIYEGVAITVVPAISHCGTPWFPDHISPPSEALGMAAVSAAVAAALFLYRRYERKLRVDG